MGNNHEAAVSNLFEKVFTFSKPYFYYSSHSCPKISIRSTIIIFTQSSFVILIIIIKEGYT